MTLMMMKSNHALSFCMPNTCFFVLECLSIAVETVQMLGGGGGTLNCLLGHPLLNRVGWKIAHKPKNTKKVPKIAGTVSHNLDPRAAMVLDPVPRASAHQADEARLLNF